MRTTTKPPRKEKMVPFPASLDRRATLALHALEGIPDEFLRAVARHAPGERVRALAETGVVRYAPSTFGVMPNGSAQGIPSVPRGEANPSTAATIERAQARIDLLLRSLRSAKAAAEPVPLSAADAAALYDVAFAATEDLSDFLVAQDAGREGA
ncbi:MAG: hypothetical protein ACYDBY_15275 [Thermoanaerobaculia bacterium]